MKPLILSTVAEKADKPELKGVKFFNLKLATYLKTEVASQAEKSSLSTNSWLWFWMLHSFETDLAAKVTRLPKSNKLLKLACEACLVDDRIPMSFVLDSNVFCNCQKKQIAHQDHWINGHNVPLSQLQT